MHKRLIFQKSNLSIFFLCTACLGCAGASQKTETDGARAVDNAQQIVDAYASRIGITLGTNAAPPASIDEVLKILKEDDTSRFDQALTYLNGMKGPEALALRASFEVGRAGLLLGIGELFSAEATRAAGESSVLTTKKQQGPSLSETEERDLTRYQDEEQTYRELSGALSVLASSRIEAALTLADSAVRQYPDKAEGYITRARIFALQERWRLYDEQVNEAERLLKGEERFGLQYQKAVEEWKRNASPEQAEKMLVLLREKFPEYVRIQATLVLVQTSPAERAAELLKLKGISPRHPLVLLAGPTIQKENELANAVRDAISPVSPLSDDDQGAQVAP